MIFKKKPTIEFSSTEWTARKYYPIQLARETFPDYWKKMESKMPTGVDTVRKCPGISDWMSLGYIIPAWTDIEIDQTGPYGPAVMLSNGRESASAHPPEQCQGMLEQKTHHHGSVKLPYVWRIKTSPGWSVMLVPLWYWKDQPWEAMPGIIHSDNHHGEVNLNFILKSKEEKITVPAGTPLVQVIPFKREPVHAVTRATTKEDLSLHNIVIKSYQWAKNGVTKFYKIPLKYTVEHKDTELHESLKFPIERF
jgi:hypothetical protein